ncbi:MAG: hypothetical protein JSU04_08485 [Bdellovibrionales bacterium]|nr:hypothetical protein [Bdellovibrionales bacterium]
MKYFLVAIAIVTAGSFSLAKEKKSPRKPSGTAEIVGTGQYLRGAGPQGSYLQFSDAAGAALMADFNVSANTPKEVTFTVTCDSGNNCVLERGH